MTKQEIIDMARDAGLHRNNHTTPERIACIERFAALVEAKAAKAEREACAKTRTAKPRVLPKYGTGALHDDQQYCFEKGWKEGAAYLRAAIRARGTP